MQQISILDDVLGQISFDTHKFYLCAAEELGIKELVPAYLDPNVNPNELATGVSFASGASGYDPETSKAVVFILLFFYFIFTSIFVVFFIFKLANSLACIYNLSLLLL